jgi:hypothetical protein
MRIIKIELNSQQCRKQREPTTTIGSKHHGSYTTITCLTDKKNKALLSNRAAEEIRRCEKMKKKLKAKNTQ